jgi:hypothetical protein
MEEDKIVKPAVTEENSTQRADKVLGNRVRSGSRSRWSRVSGVAITLDIQKRAIADTRVVLDLALSRPWPEPPAHGASLPVKRGKGVLKDRWR